MPSKLGLNKFQEWPPSDSGIQVNLLEAGALPRTLLGELTALSQNPQQPTLLSAFGPLALALQVSRLTRNTRHGPCQHDELDPSMAV